MKVKMTPLEGEKLIAEIEGDLSEKSSGIIGSIISGIQNLLSILIGCRKLGYLVLTDKRIVLYSRNTIFWVFNTYTSTASVLPQSVSTVGYAKKGAVLGCLCSDYFLDLTLISGYSISMRLKGSNEQEASNYANVMYEAIKS